MNRNEARNDEIDLIEIFKALWRNVIPIFFVTLLAGVLAFGYTFLFVSPKYSATATMYVNNSTFSFGSTSFSISSGELNAANTLVDVYSEILKSRTTLEQVIEEAELPYTYSALNNMIEVESADGTGIFYVTAESSSPMEAEKIANTIAKILPDRISDIVDGASVRIVDYAIVPAHRSSPSYVRNLAVGMILGFLIIAGITAVKSVLNAQEDTIIRSADDLKRFYPELPVLAVIPDMTKSDKKGYYQSYYTEDKIKKKKTAKAGKEAK